MGHTVLESCRALQVIKSTTLSDRVFGEKAQTVPRFREKGKKRKKKKQKKTQLNSNLADVIDSGPFFNRPVG